MAKQTKQDTIALFNDLAGKIGKGQIAPFYLLMGEEPYWVERLCSAIMGKAISDEQRDFNQTIFYGADSNVDQIISASQRYPMMAERQLVVVREAQALRRIEDLQPYLEHIVDTTVLVVCLSGKSVDKRTAFYKKAGTVGVVFESSKLAQEAVPAWIESYFQSQGRKIEMPAAMLLAEFAGNDLRKLVIEAEKLSKAVAAPAAVTAADIETYVGISREFNTTELSSALAFRDAAKAFRIAYYFGLSPKQYPIQMTLAFLHFFFAKVEQIHATIYASGGRMSVRQACESLRLFGKYGEPFLAAASRYPLTKVMQIIGLIRDCDYASKSNARGEATDGELLVELLGKIL